MAIQFTIVLVIFLLVIFWLKPFTRLPGPIGIPWIGNLHQLGNEPHKKFLLWGKKYGDVFFLKFGFYNVMVLNNPSDIRNAFRKNVFSGREKFKAHGSRSNFGIIFNDGSSCKEQRNFSVKQFTTNELNKSSVEAIIYNAIDEIIDLITKSIGRPIQSHLLFNSAIMNLICEKVCGKRFLRDDLKLQTIINDLTTTKAPSKLESFELFFPVLHNTKKKILSLFGCKERQSTSQIANSLIGTTLKQRLRDFNPNKDSSDFVQQYLRKLNDTLDLHSSFYKTAGEANLMRTVLDLFVGGTESTAAVLNWAFLLLATHLTTQQKLYDEIKLILGTDKTRGLEYRKLMPYANAVLDEVLRYSSVVPTGLFHSATEDTYFSGYKISKGTLVISNLYGVMHDQLLWSDPEVFRPERFQTKEGKKLRDYALLPFSTGKRSCIGMSFAKDIIFLVLVRVLQKFQVDLSSNDKGNAIEYHSGKLLVPKTRLLKFKQRNN